jgi:hypothetical protein
MTSDDNGGWGGGGGDYEIPKFDDAIVVYVYIQAVYKCSVWQVTYHSVMLISLLKGKKVAFQAEWFQYIITR